MNYTETPDETHGGIDNLDADFSMLKIWQTEGNCLNLTVCDDDMNARTYTFTSQEEEPVFAKHQHGPTKHASLREKFQSTPSTVEIETVSPHGHLRISRDAQHSFTIRCNSNNAHEDSPEYWETRTTVGTDGDVIKLDISSTQGKRAKAGLFQQEK